MDIDKITEKLKDLLLAELKAEFREFKNAVTGELAGYRLALEGINGRVANLEEEVRDLRRALNETNKRIDETNKRIDDTRAELKAEIDNTRVELKAEIAKNTERIDHLNLRVDNLTFELSNVKAELSKIRSDLNQALSQKEIVTDLLIRVERLEHRLM